MSRRTRSIFAVLPSLVQFAGELGGSATSLPPGAAVSNTQAVSNRSDSRTCPRSLYVQTERIVGVFNAANRWTPTQTSIDVESVAKDLRLREPRKRVLRMSLPRRAFSLAAVVAVAALAPQVALASNMRRTAVVAAFEKAGPSVVNIHGRKTVPSDQVVSTDSFRQVNGMGTGVVIDERGYILTNSHVVEGVGRIQVSLNDETTMVGRLIANDPASDLAVIKVDVAGPLRTISVGTSHDLLRGEPVIAIGNAYGYTHTVSEGIISAINRTVQISETQKYENLIQTSACINPGNSGGPLLNIDGEMIGINVAVRVGAQGIGFALPVDDAMLVAARLMSVERVAQTSHGIDADTINTGQAQSKLVVRSVLDGENSEIAAGDVIVSVAGKPVRRNLDLERRLIGINAGERVDVQVRRNEKLRTVKIALRSVGKSPSRQLEKRAWKILGLQLGPIASSEFSQLGVRYTGGLRVLAVRGGSTSDRQGIRRGDVLVGLHKWETISMENIAYVLDSDEFLAAQPAKFFILRGDETLFGHMNVSLQLR